MNKFSDDLLDAVTSILKGVPVEEKKSLDPVDKKELKGKHSDREDGDIDNDGDKDDSDEYLHKKRKAISKAMNKEEVEIEEAKDLDADNVEKALKHDCATHVEHAEWGLGNCIPGMHTIEQVTEDTGIVTHYDVMFEHGIEESVPVTELKVIKSMNHGHPRKKKEG